MESTQLGRTGRQVSRLGFGGAPAGLTNYLGHYSPTAVAGRVDIEAFTNVTASRIHQPPKA